MRALAAVRLHLARRMLTAATGVAASVPVLVATVNAVRAGWVPGADQAIIATRAYDVFTSHPPLVGQYTLAGFVTGHVTHSLGPLLFWLLAIPAHFGSAASMTWTMGVANSLSIIGAVALARRRGGAVLMFASAIAIALMCQSLAAETFHDVWNPSAGLFPFTFEIFLCWSLACGEHRLLPLTLLVASFVVQAHLMYLPPTVGLLAVGLAGMTLSLWTRRRSGGGAPRRTVAVWLAASAAVLALCWSAPVVDQLSERPGNMTLVVRSATAHKATLGTSVGWHAVVRAVGVRPWWLYIPAERWERKYDVRATPSHRAELSAIALLAALAAAGALAAWRRRYDLAAGALIGLVLCAALAAVAASTPTPRLLSATLGYTMWWGSQVGMWVWLMLAWAAWLAVLGIARALAPALQRASPRRPARAGDRSAAVLTGVVLASLAGVGATVAVGAAVASSEKPDEHQPLYRPTAALAAHLDAAVPRGATVQLLGSLNIATMPIKPALRYFLVRHGVRPLAPGSYLRLGGWYELYHRPYRLIAYVENGTRAPARGVRLLDRVHFTTGWGPEVVSLWIEPHPTKPRRIEPPPRPAARAGARR